MACSRLSRLIAALLWMLSVSSAFAQTSSTEDAADSEPDARIFGIIPNYRTTPSLTTYTPLTSRTKFTLATEDAFDRGTFILAGLFSAQAQWTKAEPTFGHGIGAYGRYYSTALSDLVVGDFLTEAVFPRLLHQDPRYFRLGKGGAWRRLGYAIGQLAWTHNDSGRGWFNASEIFGNATAVAIGNAYYPDSRNVSRNVSRVSWQLGTDAAANVLKEFWPDLNRRFGRSPRPNSD